MTYEALSLILRSGALQLRDTLLLDTYYYFQLVPKYLELERWQLEIWPIFETGKMRNCNWNSTERRECHFYILANTDRHESLGGSIIPGTYASHWTYSTAGDSKGPLRTPNG